MLVAGIWDGWRAPDGTVLRTFAVLMTEANAMMREIHHRMPVIIEAEDVVMWMAGDAETAAELMRPAAEGVEGAPGGQRSAR